MLTKAIFTGGVLALLSGSIVYFGIDGADALETEITKDARIADTELAGAASEDAVSEETIVKSADSKLAEAKPEPAAAAEPTLSDEERMKKARIERARLKRAKAKNADLMEAEEQLSVGETESGDLKMAAAEELDAQAEQVSPQPKTKWLDQYLKKAKPENTSENKSDETPKALMSNEDKMSKEEASSATTYDASSASGASSTAKNAATAEKPSSAKRYPKGTDHSAIEAAEIDESKTVRGRIMMKMSESQSGSETEGEEMIDPATQETMTKKKIVIQMDGEDPARWMTDGNDIDIEMMIEDMMQENDDIEKDVRIFRMDRRKDRAKRSARRSQNTVDYDFVLSEARKLQVVDMRNIAFFEIIDYAVDRKDFSEAADILQELSDPELRDTARAKIGVGLAKIGDSEAAFAVLDEMEIDELTASMRLEIITALMATKAERIAPALRR